MFENIGEPELPVSFAMSAGAVLGSKVQGSLTPSPASRPGAARAAALLLLSLLPPLSQSSMSNTVQSQHTTAKKATGIGPPTNSTRRVVEGERTLKVPGALRTLSLEPHATF
jgi:hypothetical protein